MGIEAEGDVLADLGGFVGEGISDGVGFADESGSTRTREPDGRHRWETYGVAVASRQPRQGTSAYQPCRN